MSADRSDAAAGGFIASVPSPEAMRALGRAFGSLCRGGEVIALDGELGAGKSVFVRGLVEGLGIDPSQVSSPTFVIMQRYRAPDAGALDLVHADAYRLKSPAAELEDVGWTEAAGAPGSVAVLEWASRAKEVLPADVISIEIAHGAAPDGAGTAPGALPVLPPDASTIEPTTESASWRHLALRDPHASRAAAFATLASKILAEALATASTRPPDGAAPCPICGAPVAAAAPNAPFCSPRCRRVDLGRWLGGRYRVSRPLGPDDLDDLGDAGGFGPVDPSGRGDFGPRAGR